MKKILLSLVMVFLTISANSQVTWNVRAGGGQFDTEECFMNYSSYEYYYYYTYDWYSVPCAAMAVQVNIPFKLASKFTFSPTFMAACSYESRIEFPLYFGYKIPIVNQILFFPKIGPMFGYDVCKESFMIGPSIELAFEIKHFIVSGNVSLDLVDPSFENEGGPPYIGGYATIGYKF
ncbi:MAG: hypothetical protein ACI3X7_07255 [Bacteroidaceae bacterium]